jgi:hypothetical protein
MLAASHKSSRARFWRAGDRVHCGRHSFRSSLHEFLWVFSKVRRGETPRPALETSALPGKALPELRFLFLAIFLQAPDLAGHLFFELLKFFKCAARVCFPDFSLQEELFFRDPRLVGRINLGQLRLLRVA